MYRRSYMLQKSSFSAKQYKSIGIIIISLLIVTLLFVLNHFMPLFADDYSYSYSFMTHEPITSIRQILPSQIAHYQNINGRIVTHTLAQLFLMMGDTAFDIVNSFVSLGLLFLIYFHACGTFRNFSISHFAIIGMLLFLETPAFGQSYLWTTGAANYQYGILIILCVMIPYRLQAEGKDVFSSWFSGIFATAIFLFLGILAGWTNENTSVAMIAMLIAYMILFRVRSIKIRTWNITCCIGAIIGCTLMLTAPGTAKRLNHVGGSGGIIMWCKNFIIHSTWLVVYTQWILLILLALICVYLYQKRHLLTDLTPKRCLKIFDSWGIFLIYLLGFLGSVYSMIVSPGFPERTWSGPIILILIAVCSFSYLPDLSGIPAKIGKTVVIISLLLSFMGTYVHAFLELRYINNAFQERVAIIETSLENGDRDVEIPCIFGANGYCGYTAWGDLNINSSDWPNDVIARYYGADKIIRIDISGEH